MKMFFLFIAINCFFNPVVAQDGEPFVKTGFVIVQSTTNYAAAKKTAVTAAKQLALKLDLRGLLPDKKSGLTFSENECENEGGYPCYIARGRYDAGEYVSIEWSNAIDKFAKGYYVVIVASGNKTTTKTALANAKKIYKDAYLKTASVYVGCMH